MAHDLVFRQTRAGPVGQVDVVFGQEFEAEVPDNEATLEVAFPALTLEAAATTPLDVSVVAQFPPVQLTAQADYQSRANRPVVGDTQSVYQVAARTSSPVASRTQDTLRTPTGSETRYERAIPLDTPVAIESANDLLRTRRGHADNFGNALKVPTLARYSAWQEMLRGYRPNIADRFGNGITAQRSATSPFANALHDRRASLKSKYQEARARHRTQYAPYQVAKPYQLGRSSRFQEALRPPVGMYIRVIVTPPNPPIDQCYVPPIGLVELVFKQLAPASPYLVFACDTPIDVGPAPQYTIPVRRVYYMLNEVQFKRVSDNTSIEIIGGSTTTDRDSYAWGFNATLPFTELDKIAPDSNGPVEVELSLNGFKWRFLVEDYSYDEAFSNKGLSITGRSVTAVFDSPYAAAHSLIQTNATTSRQLAEEELSRTDGPTGFTLDWGLIDPLGWLVPDNSWSYQDQTPVQALKLIAESVGGYVQSHPSDKVFLVKSGYPTSSWDWATTPADIAVPRAIITKQSLNWTQKPEYNGIYVSGEKTGKTTFAKRANTAGDYQAPMYVNALITDPAAAREYARTYLSSGGKQAEVTSDIPLSSLTKLWTPGTLIEFTDGGFKGLVRGVTVSFSLSDRLVTIGQSANVERHYF